MDGDWHAQEARDGKHGAKAKSAHRRLHFEFGVIVALTLLGLAVPLLSWLFRILR